MDHKTFEKMLTLVCLTLIVFALSGCGAAPTPDPTPTPAPPTATPIPPTPTPIPPTATPTSIPPTATPTLAPIVTLTGRVLYAGSEEPVADAMVMITGEDGGVEFSAGILQNPSGDTDSTGRFSIEIEKAFLEKKDYQVMVAVNIFTRMSPITTEEGVPVVLEVESVPSEIDLGDIFVQR